MPQYCAFGCKNVDTSVKLHLLPNPAKFPKRFETWVGILGGKLEKPSDYEFYKKKKVCDIHFSDEHRNCFKRLNSLAVPSLNLPGKTRLCNNTKPPVPVPVTQAVNIPATSSQVATASTSEVVATAALVPVATMPAHSRTNCYFLCQRPGPLHHFPVPSSDQERFVKWKSVLAEDVKYKSDMYIFNQIRLCNNHFESYYLSPANRLTRNAVPTLCITEPTDYILKEETESSSEIETKPHHLLIDGVNNMLKTVGDLFMEYIRAPFPSIIYEFRDCTQEGLKYSYITNACLNKTDSIIDINLFSPKLVCHGKYTMLGKIGDIFVDCDGDANVKCLNYSLIHAYYEIKDIKDKRCLFIKKYYFDVEPLSTTKFEFKNLFIDDKEKSDKIHQYLNDKHNRSSEELRSQLLYVILDVLIARLNDYFATVSVGELLPELS